MAYTTLATVKLELGKDTTDSKDDLITAAITAAEKMIDQRCGRSFNLDGSTSARTFRGYDRLLTLGDEQTVRIDDYGTTTGMTVETRESFAGTWTTVTGWEARPHNASASSHPFGEVAYTAGWMAESMWVRVTAKWGWPAVPGGVTQAATLLAARLYRRKDSPEGVLGSSEWGAVRVSRLDPDVEGLIAPYITIFA